MASGNSKRYQQMADELEGVRRAFLDLLHEIPDADFERVRPGEGWTAKQEMVHIVQVLGVIPAGILKANAGSGRSALSLIPTAFRSWVNGHIVVPVMSRRATRASIAESYERAHGALVRLLATLPEEAWSKGAHYPGKFRTVEQMAHRQAEHFREHAKHIRRGGMNTGFREEV